MSKKIMLGQTKYKEVDIKVNSARVLMGLLVDGYVIKCKDNYYKLFDNIYVWRGGQFIWTGDWTGDWFNLVEIVEECVVSVYWECEWYDDIPDTGIVCLSFKEGWVNPWLVVIVRYDGSLYYDVNGVAHTDVKVVDPIKLAKLLGELDMYRGMIDIVWTGE